MNIDTPSVDVRACWQPPALRSSHAVGHWLPAIFLLVFAPWLLSGCGGGSSGYAGGFVHLENASMQGAQYSFSVSQEYVNYNEFSYCMCDDEAAAYDEFGNSVGTVDHDATGTDCLVP